MSLAWLLGLVLFFGGVYYFGIHRPKQQREAERAAIAAQDHPESVPLDERAVDQGPRAAMGDPAKALFRSGSDRRTVFEIRPTQVRVGSVDDFTGLDGASKAKLAGSTLYYVSYQATYVSGDAQQPYSRPRLKLGAGSQVSRSVTIMQMSGFKNKANKSGCENPGFEGTFGKGSTLPACEIVSLPGGAQPTAILAAVKGDSDSTSTVSWPVTVTPRK